MTNLKITYLPIDDLLPNPGNPRTHSKKQIKQLERSVGEFGFVSPVLVDRDNRIVAGHGRVMAARNLGMATVPTVSVAHLTPAQAKAYLIADNKLAEDAGWDLELLTAEIRELAHNLDFDPTLTGFQMAEIDQLLLDTGAPAEEEHGLVPADRSQPAVFGLAAFAIYAVFQIAREKTK